MFADGSHGKKKPPKHQQVHKEIVAKIALKSTKKGRI
jgi:hypothetical protein